MQDYKPTFQNSNFLDKLSDKFLGTNRVQQVNYSNQMEQYKALQMNKYQYNIDGMKNAGINPLMMSGNLSNSIGTTPNAPSQNPSMGVFGDGYSNLVMDIFQQSLDYVNPKEIKKEMKNFIKAIL